MGYEPEISDGCQEGDEGCKNAAKDGDLMNASYGVWVHDQCEPFSMESVVGAVEYEAVGMNGEFNMENGSGSAIDADSMLLGAGIGAVVVLLVAALIMAVMKWRKNSAKGQVDEMSEAVDASNAAHVADDSSEVAKVDGVETVAV